MRKIGFDIYDKKNEPEKVEETKPVEAMGFKEYLKSPEYKKVLDGTCEGLKIATTIGNGVIMGSLWALCTCFPVVGIPLKICAGISATTFGSMLSEKTDAYIDRTNKNVKRFIDNNL